MNSYSNMHLENEKKTMISKGTVVYCTHTQHIPQKHGTCNTPHTPMHTCPYVPMHTCAEAHMRTYTLTHIQ